MKRKVSWDVLERALCHLAWRINRLTLRYWELYLISHFRANLMGLSGMAIAPSFLAHVNKQANRTLHNAAVTPAGWHLKFKLFFSQTPLSLYPDRHIPVYEYPKTQTYDIDSSHIARLTTHPPSSSVENEAKRSRYGRNGRHGHRLALFWCAILTSINPDKMDLDVPEVLT